MDQKPRIAYFVRLAIISIALSSCEAFHFANPLPVDSRNIYKTPKRLRGFVTDGDSAPEGYRFEKKFLTLTDDRPVNIINGIWIDPRDTSTIQKSDTVAWMNLQESRRYKSLYSIVFDSLKRPMDTVQNYVIKGSKIYFIQEDLLSPGFPYQFDGDTIRAITSQFHFIELGPNAFFRKVNADYYLLNLRGNEIFNGDNSDDFSSLKHWWQVLLISKGEDGNVEIHYWKDKIKKDPSLIYSVSDNYYYDNQWTRKDILRLIGEGAFEPLK